MCENMRFMLVFARFCVLFLKGSADIRDGKAMM